VNTIGILGTGYMGSALARGLQAREPKRKILLFDVEEKKAQTTAAICKGRVAASTEKLIEESGITVIAIKPQQLDDFFEQHGSTGKNRRFISIAAGTKIARFQKALHTEQVVRFMPNLAAAYSASAVGVAFPDAVEEDFRRDALSIAGALGKAVPIPEELMSAYTGLSGSGIAYVFAFLHAMALGGAQAGISYETSLEIAGETLRGALKVLEEGKEAPSQLLTRVASPAGTTIEGIRALEEGGFTAAVMDAVVRAAERASQLEG
jgi:pyrroline-5-carboxylate reductase